ncbi:MAG: LysM domain-containing protein [Pirellulales bacterium]|nr:LysM domain-containing protein [Pirellulales bacterium]
MIAPLRSGQTPGIDPRQVLPAPTALEASAFVPTSRYHGLPIRCHVDESGRQVAYVERRLLPPPEAMAELREHRVVQGDRLDLLAHRYLGDPEQFWRLCDANGAMRPDDLVHEVGRPLRVTLPEGIPGAPTRA